MATDEDASHSPFWGAQAASLFISAACRDVAHIVQSSVGPHVAGKLQATTG